MGVAVGVATLTGNACKYEHPLPNMHCMALWCVSTITFFQHFFLLLRNVMFETSGTTSGHNFYMGMQNESKLEAGILILTFSVDVWHLPCLYREAIHSQCLLRRDQCDDLYQICMVWPHRVHITILDNFST